MRRLLVLLVAAFALACGTKSLGASPPAHLAASLEVSADTFKVKAPCHEAVASDTLYLVSCLTAFADSSTGSALGSVTIARGGTAVLTVVRALAPGARFAVGVIRQGVNQSGALSAPSAPVFVGFTALIGAPPVPSPFTVTICRVGVDPNC